MAYYLKLSSIIRRLYLYSTLLSLLPYLKILFLVATQRYYLTLSLLTDKRNEKLRKS